MNSTMLIRIQISNALMSLFIVIIYHTKGCLSRGFFSTTGSLEAVNVKAWVILGELGCG